MFAVSQTFVIYGPIAYAVSALGPDDQAGEEGSYQIGVISLKNVTCV